MTVKDEPVTDPSSLFETELEALYRVSRVLSRSLNLRETLRAVLQVLHDFAGMQRGMVTLLDPDSGDLLVSVVQSDAPAQAGSVRYRAGEGVVGAIIARGDTVVVRRIADEPRFLDRLGVYDPQLPFIGVPIRVGESSPVGVLAAQPQSADVELLSERGRFLEMVANLTAQTVRLSWEVERERRDLADERDQLRRAVRGEYGFSSVVGHTPAMRKVF
ncbi:MAG TPA: GAF domain-containing protein, partial [Gammaproteobacteria bacterium]|nr:GAF domain-containing protein [Gammaproteobacteria bacterium]